MRLVKIALKVAGGIVVGLAFILLLALAAQFLLWGNTTSLEVCNDSNLPLQSVAIFVPGSAFSGHTSDMPANSSSGFAVDTRMVVPLRVIFDAQGRHYEASHSVLLPPIGAYFVSIRINSQMQVSVSRTILW